MGKGNDNINNVNNEEINDGRIMDVDQLDPSKTYAHVRKITRVPKQPRFSPDAPVDERTEEEKLKEAQAYNKFFQELENENFNLDNVSVTENSPESVKNLAKNVKEVQNEERIDINAERKKLAEDVRRIKRKMFDGYSSQRDTYKDMKAYADAVKKKWLFEIKNTDNFKFDLGNLKTVSEGGRLSGLMEDLAPINQFIYKLTSRLESHQIAEAINNAHYNGVTENREANEKQEVDKKYYENLNIFKGPRSLALVTFPYHDKFFTELEAIWEKNLSADYDDPKYSNEKYPRANKFFDGAVVALEKFNDSSKAKAKIENEDWIIRSKSTWTPVKNKQDEVVKWHLHSQYLGLANKELVSQYTQQFDIDKVKNAAEKFVGGDSPEVGKYALITNNYDNLVEFVSRNGNNFVKTHPQTDSYGTTLRELEEMGKIDPSTYYDDVENMLDGRQPVDRQNEEENSFVVKAEGKEYYKPTPKLVVENQVGEDDEYDEIEEEYFEEIGKEEYDELVAQNLKDEKEIPKEEVKDDGKVLPVGRNVDDKTRAIAQVAKLTEAANLYAQVSKTHSGRFFSMIFHPFKYHDEGVLLNKLRENLKAQGLTDEMLDRLKSGRQYETNEFLAEFKTVAENVNSQYKKSEKEMKDIRNAAMARHPAYNRIDEKEKNWKFAEMEKEEISDEEQFQQEKELRNKEIEESVHNAFVRMENKKNGIVNEEQEKIPELNEEDEKEEIEEKVEEEKEYVPTKEDEELWKAMEIALKKDKNTILQQDEKIDEVLLERELKDEKTQNDFNEIVDEFKPEEKKKDDLSI